MDEESYWMLVDDDLRDEEHIAEEAFISSVLHVWVQGSYFKYEIWRRARSHCGS